MFQLRQCAFELSLLSLLENESNLKGLVVENEQDETSSLLKHDEKAPGCKQHFKFKLLCEIRKDFILLFPFSDCQWGVGVTHKPGYIVRCSCMKW